MDLLLWNIYAPSVLAEYGVTTTEVVPAKLSGFEPYIRPRVNLVRTDRSYVYGTLVAVTHEDIPKLYSNIEERFGLKYFPEPVLAEALDGVRQSGKLMNRRIIRPNRRFSDGRSIR